MRPETPESCGNGDGVETLEIQKQDSHFPTAPMACGARKKSKSVYNVPGTLCIPCAGLDTHSCERSPFRRHNQCDMLQLTTSAVLLEVE